jgi:hypothetical protein
VNASKPDFIYKDDIQKITQAILWMLDGVDNDVIASSLHNVASELKLSGALFSREDISNSVEEVFSEKYLDSGKTIPDADVLEKITDKILESDWWLDNSLGVNSSYSLYKNVEEYIAENFSSDNILGEKENNV